MPPTRPDRRLDEDEERVTRAQQMLIQLGAALVHRPFDTNTHDRLRQILDGDITEALASLRALQERPEAQLRKRIADLSGHGLRLGGCGMKRLRLRREAPTEVAVGEYDLEVDGPTDGGELAGWSTGARANASVLWRWALWAVVIASPLAGIGACSAARTSQARPAAVSTPTEAADGAQGPAGFAELFVTAYVGAGEDDVDALAAYYPGATSLQLEGPSDRQHAETVTTVRARQASPGIWSVTVAARVTTPQPKPPKNDDRDKSPSPAVSVRYFQVPIAAAPTEKSGAAGAYAALSMPSEVAAPQEVSAPPLAYEQVEVPAPGDERAEAVEEFLSAYLAGSGELNRYLAPGVQLRPVTPAPYREVTVERLGAVDKSGEATAPIDGARQQLLVEARAAGADKVRVPLTYSLTLAARAGRWEIASLDEAPAMSKTPARGSRS